MAPGDRPALGVQARGEPVVVVGSVHVVLDVLLAGPDDLDRPIDVLRDRDRLGDKVDLEPPAEAATQEVVVHPHLFRWKAGHLGGDRLGAGRHLRPHPHVAAVRRTCTVQLTGSMVACARNGSWYTASTFVGALAIARATSPSLRATTPVVCEAPSSSRTTGPCSARRSGRRATGSSGRRGPAWRPTCRCRRQPRRCRDARPGSRP